MHDCYASSSRRSTLEWQLTAHRLSPEPAGQAPGLGHERLLATVSFRKRFALDTCGHRQAKCSQRLTHR